MPGLVKGLGFQVWPGPPSSRLSTVLTWLGWKWRRRSSIQRSLSAAERQEKQRLPPAQVTCWGGGFQFAVETKGGPKGSG